VRTFWQTNVIQNPIDNASPIDGRWRVKPISYLGVCIERQLFFTPRQARCVLFSVSNFFSPYGDKSQLRSGNRQKQKWKLSNQGQIGLPSQKARNKSSRGSRRLQRC
jgi:hypothetical protein